MASLRTPRFDASKVSVSDFFYWLFSIFARITAILSFAACIIAYVLLQLGIIGDIKIFILLSMGLALGIFLLVADTMRIVKGLSDRVERFLDQSTKHSKLQASIDCYRDLHERVKKLQPREKLIVEGLAIDLHHTWELIISMMRDLLLPSLDVEIRLLVLTSNPNDITPKIEQLDNWCKAAAQRLDEIKEALEKDDKLLISEGKRISLQIKQYKALPMIHGFSIKHPFKVWYIAFCRWGGKNHDIYDRGLSEFHKIHGGDTTPTLADMTEIFDSQFSHHWASSEELCISKVIENKLSTTSSQV
jgi:hypothetical protein